MIYVKFSKLTQIKLSVRCLSDVRMLPLPNFMKEVPFSLFLLISRFKFPKYFDKFLLHFFQELPLISKSSLPYQSMIVFSWSVKWPLRSLFLKQFLGKVFLEISQNSQEKTCARVSCEFCKISKNTFFYRTPPMATSFVWFPF